MTCGTDPTRHPAQTQTLKRLQSPTALDADLLGRRPEVVAARWHAEAAHAQVQMARSPRSPATSA